MARHGLARRASRAGHHALCRGARIRPAHGPRLGRRDRGGGRQGGAEACRRPGLPLRRRRANARMSLLAIVAGTFDTKAAELAFLADRLALAGLAVVTVDLATTGTQSEAMVQAHEVAARHPDGAEAVFTGDRGTAVTAMAEAFEAYLLGRDDVGGVISAGGSGNTSLVAPA